MAKTIYIAGKVSGEPLAEVTAKFGQVQKQLEAKGYTVINPLEVTAAAFDNKDGENDRWLHMPWSYAMRLTVAAMMQADEIYMLRDWRTSPGAMIEHQLAERLKFEIHYQ
jgi:Domain of unknown function (DUF4406)